MQTAGEDEKCWQEEEDRDRLNNQDVSQYLALVARANTSHKETCGEMSNRTRGDLRRLGGLGATSLGAPEASGASSSRTPAES